jgi:protein-tyrosine phosphatase
MMRKLLGAAVGLALGLAALAPARADEPVKIAFVDTGNTGRSVTAEALADAAIGARHLPIAIISRAVDLDPFVTAPEANAAVLLEKRGIDVSAHRAAQLTANDVKHANLILTMTRKHKDTILAAFPEAKGKIFTLAEYATGRPSDVVDAYGKPMEVYEQVLAQIDGYLPAALDKALRKGAPD